MYPNQNTSHETHENSFDEIESLRAEVKRLSDIVTEQTEHISYIQKTFNQVIYPLLALIALANFNHG